jgi:hypothetical protein
VDDNEFAIDPVDVEFDGVYPVFQCTLEPPQRVFGLDTGRAPMTDNGKISGQTHSMRVDS